MLLGKYNRRSQGNINHTKGNCITTLREDHQFIFRKLPASPPWIFSQELCAYITSFHIPRYLLQLLNVLVKKAAYSYSLLEEEVFTLSFLFVRCAVRIPITKKKEVGNYVTTLKGFLRSRGFLQNIPLLHRL